MSTWFWARGSSLLAPPVPPVRSRWHSLARAVGWTGRSFVVLFGLLLTVAAAGCQPKNREIGPAEVPVVPVSHPLERVVTDYVDFTGRTDAVQSVNIIPRVTGYLTKMPFEEGSEVKKGDLLFVIDQRPYQAQLDQSQSQVKLNEAQLDLAKKTYARYQELDKKQPGAVSKLLLDQAKATVDEAAAQLEAQKKSLDIYKLNKEFTEVVSPIDGQVSRYYLTLHNLVNQDQTLLTTIMSLDPMYAYFDMDERTLLQIRKAISEGKMKTRAEGDIPVLLGLQNEDGFPHKGTINFVNNQVNSTTGSITMRGVFDNPRLVPKTKVSNEAGSEASPTGTASPPGVTNIRDLPIASASVLAFLSEPLAQGPFLAASTLISKKVNTRRYVPRLFSPGMYVRIRLPIGEPHKALLIIDRAISSDQGLKFVYVLDAKNKVQTRSIKTGPLQEDGLRVVSGDIKPDDWVVVGAIQQVRSQMVVKPDPRLMPSLGGQSEAVPQAGSETKPNPSANGKPKD